MSTLRRGQLTEAQKAQLDRRGKQAIAGVKLIGTFLFGTSQQVKDAAGKVGDDVQDQFDRRQRRADGVIDVEGTSSDEEDE